MKKIRELNNPTSGLAEYLNIVGDETNWDEFRSHNSGTSYNELRDALTQNQHGICAYCEINLTVTEMDRQIEHVIPRNDPQQGAAREADVTNMIACCKGGTLPAFAPSEKSRDEDRYRKPVKRNMSCGQAKGDQNDPNFIDPRILPALPSLMRVIDNGLIEADGNACQIAGFLPEHVTRTIEILNLNAERLRSAREKRWKSLDEEWKLIDDIDDPDMMNDWIRSELMPDADGRLVSFFTTTRSYFDTFTPLSESILAQQPQTWI